jgi:hypothetical protein
LLPEVATGGGAEATVLAGAGGAAISRIGGLVSVTGCANDPPHIPQKRYSGLLSYPQWIQRTYIVSSISQYSDARKVAGVGKDRNFRDDQFSSQNMV